MHGPTPARLLVALMLAGTPTLAQDVSVRAYLSQNEVGINRQFVLNVEVSGTQQVSSEPELPDMDAFAVYLGSGTSTSMQMIGGRTTVSVTFQFRFQAISEGSFEIGPVRVEAGGRVLETEPLTIMVTRSPAQSQSQPPGAAGGATEIGPRDLFVTADVSKRRAYENEAIIVEYRIYTRVDVSSYSITRLPSTAGFWVEQHEQPSSPEVERVVRDGLQYATAVIRKVAMFPTSPGTKTIAPLSVEMQVRMQARSRDPFEDFFRMPSLFENRVPVVVASEPVEIEVLPLPEAGRPRDFSGLVGEFEIAATLDKDRVQTNEALTYRVRVEGSGNLRTLSEPNISFPADFEVYPPEISEQIGDAGSEIRGSKTFEYVLIPRAPGRRELQPVELNYFDVGRGTYASAATRPIEVEITGEVAEGPTISGRPRANIDLLRQDIRFIRIAAPQLRQVDRSPFRSEGFWSFLVVPLIAVGGAWGYRRHRDRIEGDVAYARHRRADRLARRRLRHARALLSPDNQREFVAEVGRALEGFLGDKLNLSEAGLIRETARSALMERGASEDLVGEYLSCLEICDRQRFAPVDASLDEMQSLLGRAERAMADLAGGLRR